MYTCHILFKILYGVCTIHKLQHYLSYLGTTVHFELLFAWTSVNKMFHVNL